MESVDGWWAIIGSPPFYGTVWLDLWGSSPWGHLCCLCGFKYRIRTSANCWTLSRPSPKCPYMWAGKTRLGTKWFCSWPGWSGPESLNLTTTGKWKIWRVPQGHGPVVVSCPHPWRTTDQLVCFTFKAVFISHYSIEICLRTYWLNKRAEMKKLCQTVHGATSWQNLTNLKDV